MRLPWKNLLLLQTGFRYDTYNADTWPGRFARRKETISQTEGPVVPRGFILVCFHLASTTGYGCDLLMNGHVAGRQGGSLRRAGRAWR
jgi:hypothetical protein